MWRYFRIVAEVTGAGCLSIICLGILYFVFLVFTSPTILIQTWRYNHPFSQYVSDLFTSNQSIDDDTDMSAVSRSYENLREWFAHCIVKRKGKIDEYGNFDRASLLERERALQTAASTIIGDGVYSNREAKRAYRFWAITAILSIVLGMLTTIVVSLSTTIFSNNSDWRHVLLRVFAIILPAVGTAVAAIVAFYSPQAVWGQASRTFANLTQLEGDINIGLWKFHCIEKEGDQYDEALGKQVDEWTKRYVDIKTVSAATGGASGTPSSSVQTNNQTSSSSSSLNSQSSSGK